MKIYLPLIICSIIFISNSQQNVISLKTSFENTCIDTTKYQRAFDGRCTLSPENIYSNLTAFVDLIMQTNSTMTIDNFLRNYVFNEYTTYFEDKYSQNESYIDSVTDLKVNFDSLAKKIETSTSNIKMSEFYDAFEKSNMTSVVSEVMSETDNYFYDNIDTIDDLFKIVYCSYGNGFCDKSQTIFELNQIEEFADLTLDQTLLKFVNTSYFKILQRVNSTIRLKLTTEQPQVENFIKILNAKGTMQTLVSDLQNFLNNELLKQIIAYYDPTSENVIVTKKPTVRTTTANATTLKPKVTDDVAVSEGLVIGIPVAFVCLGIIAIAIALAFTSYKNKKTSVQFRSEKVIPIEAITKF